MAFCYYFTLKALSIHHINAFQRFLLLLLSTYYISETVLEIGVREIKDSSVSGTHWLVKQKTTTEQMVTSQYDKCFGRSVIRCDLPKAD